MAKTEYINMRIEPELKKQATELFDSIGLTTTDAINLFLLKCINERGIPFAVSQTNSISRNMAMK